MLRFVLCLLYLLRFLLLFLFAKSYVRSEACSLVSHLHVVFPVGEESKRFEDWGWVGEGVKKN